jgi:hypothetical protein
MNSDDLEETDEQLGNFSSFEEGLHYIIQSQITYIKQIDERVTYSFHLIRNVTYLVRSSISKVPDETRNLARELVIR